MNTRIQSEEESDLITAILAGEAGRYHQLIRPYERSVYRMSLLCMTNERDAEDVAQRTFVRAFQDLSTFPRHTKFVSWLMGMTLNEAGTHLRQQLASQMNPAQGYSEELPVDPVALFDWHYLPASLVERKEIRSLLRQAIGRLPGLDRQVFLLRDVEKLNGNEIAQVLGIDTALVRVISHRTRMMLQRILAPELRELYCAAEGLSRVLWPPSTNDDV